MPLRYEIAQNRALSSASSCDRRIGASGKTALHFFAGLRRNASEKILKEALMGYPDD
jgi:hypothetical protein